MIAKVGSSAMELGAADYQVGDCVQLEQASDGSVKSAPAVKDCSDPSAIHEVVKLTDGICGANLDQTHGLCLVPNLIEDTCYATSNPKTLTVSVSCGGKGDVKVVKRFDGTSDRSVCERFKGANPLTHPEWNRVYCVALAE